MKRLAVALFSFLSVCVAGSRGDDDLAARVVSAHERLAAAAREILSIDLNDPRSEQSGKLSSSYSEDEKILAATVVLFARKGVSARLHKEDSHLILLLSIGDELSIYGLTLMWFYRDSLFERFGASKSVQAAEKAEPGATANTYACHIPCLRMARAKHTCG